MKTQYPNRNLLLRAGLLAALCLLIRPVWAGDFEQNLQKLFPASAGGKLVIHADRGSIDITTGADKVDIQVFREVTGTSKSRADEIFTNHVVTFAQEGDTISVIAKNKSERNWSWGKSGFRVRYEVRIPSRFDVDLKTSGGNIQVTDLDGQAVASTSSGSINLAKVTGKVAARDSGGNIAIVAVGGDVTARTSSGSILVHQVAGHAELSNSGGNIQVDEAGGDVKTSTSSGSIVLGTVKGDLEARNSGGNVRISSIAGKGSVSTSSGTIEVQSVAGSELNVRNSGGSIQIGKAEGAVTAQTSSGTIKIESVKGKLEARNSGGNISLGETGSDVLAETSSGSINLRSAAGKVELRNSGGSISVEQAGGEVAARTSSGAIEIGRASGRVEARNSGGRIRVRDAAGAVVAETSSGEINIGFSQPPREETRLQVSGGGITLAVPRSAALDVDARSSGGNVVSELPLTVQGAVKTGALQGKLNGGGPAVILRASSGDIHLKASPGATALAEENEKRSK